MKLYLLTVKEDLIEGRWDVTEKQLVRAKNEDSARYIASLPMHRGAEGAAVWLDPTLSTCDVLTARGTEGFIMHDFRAG